MFARASSGCDTDGRWTLIPPACSLVLLLLFSLTGVDCGPNARLCPLPGTPHFLDFWPASWYLLHSTGSFCELQIRPQAPTGANSLLPGSACTYVVRNTCYIYKIVEQLDLDPQKQLEVERLNDILGPTHLGEEEKINLGLPPTTLLSFFCL